MKLAERAVRRRRAGFSLIEIIGVMFGLAVLLALGTAVLSAAFRIEKSAAATQCRWVLRNTLADQFRTDVHEALGTSPKIDAYTADAHCLILRHPGGRHVVYRWEDGKLLRRELPAKDTGQNLAVEPGCREVEFVRPGADGRLVGLRLTPAASFGVSRPVEFLAAVGGGTE